MLAKILCDLLCKAAGTNDYIKYMPVFRRKSF